MLGRMRETAWYYDNFEWVELWSKSGFGRYHNACTFMPFSGLCTAGWTKHCCRIVFFLASTALPRYFLWHILWCFSVEDKFYVQCFFFLECLVAIGFPTLARSTQCSNLPHTHTQCLLDTTLPVYTKNVAARWQLTGRQVLQTVCCLCMDLNKSRAFFSPRICCNSRAGKRQTGCICHVRWHHQQTNRFMSAFFHAWSQKHNLLAKLSSFPNETVG